MGPLINTNVSFSNQREEVHDELKRIKVHENYGDNFFVAARRFINEDQDLILPEDALASVSTVAVNCPVPLENKNLVILNEDRNLMLSEDLLNGCQASTSNHDLIADFSEQTITEHLKDPSENIPTQLQQQNINININTEDNQNWKNILKKNCYFLAIIAVLTVFSILLVMNKNRIWQNKINIINSNWKYSFDKVHKTLAQTFINTFSEQVKKSNLYQITKKAYEELKIEYDEQELETANKENTNLDKKLSIKEQELEVAKKDNVNLDKKLILKEQELETSKKENLNIDKKLSITKEELETAKKENANLDKKLTLKEQDLETSKKENLNLGKKLSITKEVLETAKKENANLDKKLTLKEQDFETSKKENLNLDKKLSITKEALEAAKKENANLNKKLIAKEQDYEESQRKIKDLTIKIFSLEKEVKIIDKQRVKGKERNQVLRVLKQAYKELRESCAKLKQEKIEKETIEHQEILEKAEKFLNDNKEC
ncbi:Cyanate hydratase [Gigaspora margarita]|uniref:Cyanate hydratase n=1 Tax=Gigaspora margarita TaxID=4874 RepID=A0A8H3XG92_GIGMA|nr:Cyanate hydratase [Gigaspora margarita]